MRRASLRLLGVTFGRCLSAVGVFALLASCESRGTSARRAKADSLEVASADTAPVPPPGLASASAPESTDNSKRAPKAVRLSPLADSISAYLVFAPVGETWFIVSTRTRKTFLDIGRVDTEVRRDSSRAAAYREAVAGRSTVPVGTRFRLRAPWGAEDVRATGVDTWNGRIVLRLDGSAALDSVARGKATLVATAFRTDSSAEAVADTCNRATALTTELAALVTHISDSLAQELKSGPQPPYERLRRKMSIASSQVVGCFGASRVALLVSLRAGNAEWVRERVVLVDASGKTTPLRVSDYRFRAHDLLAAFDANGDGVDDIATRATTERAGATTILVLDLKAQRLTRLTAGFAWEEQ